MTRWISLAATAALALGAAPAAAMTVAEAPPDVLLAESTRVVHGTVVASTAEPAPGARWHLRTRHRLRVWEAEGPAAAPVPDEIEVVLPGGARGDLETVVPGVPRLAPGDEVVLLLTATPWGLQPLGYALGTWRVDARGRAWRDGEAPAGAATPAPTVTRLLDALREGRP